MRVLVAAAYAALLRDGVVVQEKVPYGGLWGGEQVFVSAPSSAEDKIAKALREPCCCGGTELPRRHAGADDRDGGEHRAVDLARADVEPGVQDLHHRRACDQRRAVDSPGLRGKIVMLSRFVAASR